MQAEYTWTCIEDHPHANVRPTWMHRCYQMIMNPNTWNNGQDHRIYLCWYGWDLFLVAIYPFIVYPKWQVSCKNLCVHSLCPRDSQLGGDVNCVRVCYVRTQGCTRVRPSAGRRLPEAQVYIYNYTSHHHSCNIIIVWIQPKT